MAAWTIPSTSTDGWLCSGSIVYPTWAEYIWWEGCSIHYCNHNAKSSAITDSFKSYWPIILPASGISRVSLKYKQQSMITNMQTTCKNTFQYMTMRHLQPIGLSDSPLCRRCQAKDETSAHILCECEALALLRHAYLDSFFLEPEDIKSISLGAIWNFSKATGLP